mgnify:CR=1 FL=1
MNRYVYTRENLKLLITIGAIVGLPLLLLSVWLIIDIGAMGYCMLAGFLVLFLILFIFAISRLKWRSWHRNMKKNGFKTSGKVIDFGYKQTSGSIHHDPATLGYEEYWLKIAYVDNNGDTKTFDTPELSFAPEERKDITCDVFVYNNEVLATNFVNLNKKKTDFQEIFYYILIGVVLFGICALISWIKNLF